MSALALGNYRYWHSGQSTSITEPWEVTSQGDGQRISGRRLRNDDVLLEVEADYTGPECTALDLKWNLDRRRVQYRHQGDHVEWNESGGQNHEVVPVPAGTLLFPLLRVATGPLLGLLVQDPRWVVVPSLHDSNDTTRFLQPECTERRAECVGTDKSGKRHYRYFGGEYGDAGCEWWVGPHGLPQRYRWSAPDGEWEIRLEESWAAPTFTGFGS